MSDALMHTYARADLAFERGEGPYLYTADGRRFLDFAAGIAVNALGHSHPHLVKTLQEQAGKLWHVSNLYEIPEGRRLAERLVAHSFADKVFFCNSGAEAIEGALKLARRFHYVAGHPEKVRVISCSGAFHGRTLTTLSAAANPKYLEGCGHRRADPGRGRHPRRRPGLSQGPARGLRRIRAAAGARRDPMRHGAHRQTLRL